MVFGFQYPKGKTGRQGTLGVIVILLEPENLERMQQGDPADIQFTTYPTSTALPLAIPARNLDVVIAYEADAKARVQEFYGNSDVVGLMEWLQRGRVNREGDGDRPTPMRKGEWKGERHK